jgi:hypothetical protein
LFLRCSVNSCSFFSREEESTFIKSYIKHGKKLQIEAEAEAHLALGEASVIKRMERNLKIFESEVEKVVEKQLSCKVCLDKQVEVVFSHVFSQNCDLGLFR